MKRLYLESRYNLFLCNGNQPKSPRSALQPARTCAQCFEAVDCSSRRLVERLEPIIYVKG